MIKFIGTAQNHSEVLLFCLQQEGDNSFLKVISSSNGLTFNDEATAKYIFVFDTSQKEEQQYDFAGLRIAKQKTEYIMTYISQEDKTPSLRVAISPNLSVWYKIGKADSITHPGAVVPMYQYDDSYVMYVGGEQMHLAYSKDLRSWQTDKTSLFGKSENAFDEDEKEAANAYVLNNAILLVYYAKKQVGNKTHFLVGAAYFDKKNPSQLLWKSEEPIYELPEELYRDAISPFGSAVIEEKLFLYWLINNTTIFSVTLPIPEIIKMPKKQTYSHIVKKFHKNPIISARPHVAWESRATFNSAAIYEDGKVHFLYRALGDTDLSVLGYATSSDGLTIDYRSDMPAYIPREPFETPGNHAFSSLAQHFVSGGGYGGIEDPRITRVEDKVYLTYVAFDGATPPRAAISSISVDDFLKNEWDKWAKPKLISAPGMVNKSAVIFPKKVRGQYVVMHRVYPNILLDYVENLEFKHYLRGDYFIPPRKRFWDSKKVGAGAPPIETKDGWLLIYQSVGYQDSSRYKVGAMMLDRDHPEKVLYRTHLPIIEPVEHYENNGFKAGVVYPCGAVTVKDDLFIYYGGADSYVNAAWTNLDTFLKEMKRHQEPQLRRVETFFN